MKTKDVKKRRRVIEELTIKTFATDITRGKTLSAEAGTTGHMGGGYEKGGRTYVRLTGIDSPHITFQKHMRNNGIEIRAGGDNELDLIIDALTFITDTLKQQKILIETQRYQAERAVANPATAKQIAYLNTLLAKKCLQLTDEVVPKDIAGEMIDALASDNKVFRPELYDKYIMETTETSLK